MKPEIIANTIAHIDRIEAENAKLRAALEQIAAMKGGQGFLLSCPEIARRALEGK